MPKREEASALTEPTFYILLSLHKPTHGYAIMQDVRELTGGRVNIGAGTLYGAISSLTEKGWIRAAEGHADSGRASERRKAYVITEEGRRAFAREVERLKSLVADARSVIEQ